MAIFDPVTLVKAPENWWGSREGAAVWGREGY